MRIFLSHAAEQNAEADRLAVALRARGHRVFLDRDDLPPGGDYQTSIQQAIESSDLFCFLISIASITPKRFTLSEMQMARKRWPDPVGHVLPIMVEKLPMDSVPSYLRTVSVLEPMGDMVAESLTAIEALKPRLTRWLWPALAAAGVCAALAAAYLVWRSDARDKPTSAESTPGAARAGSSAPSGGAALRIPATDGMKDAVNGYVAYLKGLGFGGFNEDVSVVLFSKETPLQGSLRDQSDQVNAFYLDGVLYIHWSMASDPSVLLREYTHHVLRASAPKGSSTESSDVESGLADYFPASRLDSPLIGGELGALFHLPTPYIRNLDNHKAYPAAPVEQHAGGEAWAGALWLCRQRVGRPAVDAAAAQAWKTSLSAAQFGTALRSAPAAAGQCLAKEIEARNLPH